MPIGLRHMTEDLIKLVEGKHFDRERTLYVATKWADTFEKAQVGIRFVQERAWVIEPKYSEHFGIYNSLDEIWGERTHSLIEALAKSTVAFRDALKYGEAPTLTFESDEVRQQAADALKQLIHCKWSY